MTELLYLEDAYLRSCDARVVAVDQDDAGAWLTLDHTVLYAEGGGQAPDHGTVTGPGGAADVVDVQYAPGSVTDVRHLLAPGAPVPAVDDAVGVALDWERRYGLMRHHTAAHLVAAVLELEYEGTRFTGGQLYPDRGRFDVAFQEWSPDVKDALAARVNELIAKDYEIQNYWIDRAEFEKRDDLLRTAENLVDERFERIRITDIVGLDAQADGGTHVKRTKEVGTFSIGKAENKGKGHRRLKIQCTL